jgi:hypothetical protein
VTSLRTIFFPVNPNPADLCDQLVTKSYFPYGHSLVTAAGCQPRSWLFCGLPAGCLRRGASPGEGVVGASAPAPVRRREAPRQLRRRLWHGIRIAYAWKAALCRAPRLKAKQAAEQPGTLLAEDQAWTFDEEVKATNWLTAPVATMRWFLCVRVHGWRFWRSGSRA